MLTFFFNLSILSPRGHLTMSANICHGWEEVRGVADVWWLEAEGPTVHRTAIATKNYLAI
jgi:hypothetical protein